MTGARRGGPHRPDEHQPHLDDVWEDRRNVWRTVTIRAVDDVYVQVDRNTSRRKQAMLRTTLQRGYRLRSRVRA